MPARPNFGTLNASRTSKPTTRSGTLGTLNRGCFQGRGLVAVIKDARVPEFQKLGDGSIDAVYSWAVSYRCGLWVVRGSQSYNQRTWLPRDYERGGCHSGRRSLRAGVCLDTVQARPYKVARVACLSATM